MFYLLTVRRPPLPAITTNNNRKQQHIIIPPTPPKVANCFLRFVFKSSRLFGIYASIPCSSASASFCFAFLKRSSAPGSPAATAASAASTSLCASSCCADGGGGGGEPAGGVETDGGEAGPSLDLISHFA